jgi:hypothetical protein
MEQQWVITVMIVTLCYNCNNSRVLGEMAVKKRADEYGCGDTDDIGG